MKDDFNNFMEQAIKNTALKQVIISAYNKEEHKENFNFLKDMNFFISKNKVTPKELMEEFAIDYEEAVEQIKEDKEMTRYEFYIMYIYRLDLSEEMFNLMLNNKEKEFEDIEEEYYKLYFEKEKTALEKFIKEKNKKRI